MEDLLKVSEEKSPLSTRYRHITYHDTQSTLVDRLEMAESKLIDLELIAKNGAIMYDQMPKNESTIEEYKIEREKRQAFGRRHS